MTIAIDMSPLIVISLLSTAVLIVAIVTCYMDARNRCNERRDDYDDH